MEEADVVEAEVVHQWKVTERHRPATVTDPHLGVVATGVEAGAEAGVEAGDAVSNGELLPTTIIPRPKISPVLKTQIPT